MAWELNGNSNTNPPNDFIGTSDGKPLVIKTNATEAVRIDVSGNVGMGATSPASKLHVTGPGGGAVVATIEQPAGMNFVDLKSSQGGGNYGSDIRFVDSGVLNAEVKSTANSQLRFATSGVDRLTIDSNGNVGIGTTNPAGPLDILGPALEPPAGLPAPQNGLLLGLQSTAGYKWIQSYGGTLALNPKGNNVGIGTPNPDPAAKLHVEGNVSVTENILLSRNPPVGDPGFLNVLTAANIVKAWACITMDVGTPTIRNGFNIAGVTYSPYGENLFVNFRYAISSTPSGQDYAVALGGSGVVGEAGIALIVWYFPINSTQIMVRFYDPRGGAVTLPGTSIRLSLVICGIQVTRPHP